MQAETTARNSPRSPAVAVLLSLLGTGLGQIYTGQLGKAVLLLAIGLCLQPLGLLALIPIETPLRTPGIVACVLSLAIWAYSITDARRRAKRIGADYVLKDYNRWYVYVLLALMFVPLSVSAAFHIRTHVAEAFVVPAEGMYPAVHKGDRLLANKLAYRSGPLRRGDIVVFPHPNRRHSNRIKRVMALPGDSIEIRGDDVYLNDEKLPRTKIGPAGAKGPAGDIFEETNGRAKYRILLGGAGATATATTQPGAGQSCPRTEIPDGHCFVLSDKRSDANDSRAFGPIPMRHIIGRAECIYFPRWVSLRPHRGD